MFEIFGEVKLMRLLSQLDKKTGDKAIRRISRKHLKPALKEVKKDFPVSDVLPPDRSKHTRDTIKIYAGKRIRDVITLNVQSKDPNYIEKFLEHGTKNKDGSWKIRPRHYFQKAFLKTHESVKKNIVQELTAEINRLIKLQDS